MNKTTKYLLLILAGAVIFFLGRIGCKPEPTQTIKTIQVNKAKLVAMKPIIIIQTKEVVKWRSKYHEVRHDSIIPCEEKLAICDTVIVKDSTLIATQKIYIGIQDTIIKDQSAVIDSLTKSRRKFWNGFKCGFIAGNVTGGVVVGSLRR